MGAIHRFTRTPADHLQRGFELRAEILRLLSSLPETSGGEKRKYERGICFGAMQTIFWTRSRTNWW